MKSIRMMQIKDDIELRFICDDANEWNLKYVIAPFLEYNFSSIYRSINITKEEFEAKVEEFNGRFEFECFFSSVMETQVVFKNADDAMKLWEWVESLVLINKLGGKI